MKFIPIYSQKNYCWVWIPVDRQAKRFISFVCGDRSTQTGLKLWDQIKGLKTERYATDYWKSYAEFLPANQHIQTKAETYTVEGYNIIVGSGIIWQDLSVEENVIVKPSI